VQEDTDLRTERLFAVILALVAACGGTGPSQTTVDQWVADAGFTTKASLAPVALSGSYADLSGRPDLSVYAKSAELSKVARSGSYADLVNPPALAAVATSGKYSDLVSTPALAPVATSGNYADLTGKPALASVATSGSYSSLTNAPLSVSGSTATTSYSLTPATNSGASLGAAGQAWSTVYANKVDFATGALHAASSGLVIDFPSTSVRDQAFTDTSLSMNGSPYAQTFTAGMSGQLTALELDSGGPQTLPIVISDVASGTTLASISFTFAGGWNTVDLTSANVFLVQGKQFKFDMTRGARALTSPAGLLVHSAAVPSWEWGRGTISRSQLI
jgi:hypothetical protein